MAHPEGTQCTTMTSGGRKKMHYTYPDGSEMVDEFDVQTDALLVRKKRRKTMLGSLGEWVYEARAAAAPASLIASHTSPPRGQPRRQPNSTRRPGGRGTGARDDRERHIASE